MVASPKLVTSPVLTEELEDEMMVDRGTDFTFAAMAALVVALVATAFFFSPVDPNALNTQPQALLNVYERLVAPV